MKLTGLAAIVLLGSVLGFAQSPELKVKVNGVPDAQGQVVVAVFKKAAEYPLNLKDAVQQKSVPAQAGSVEVSFESLPSGEYTVAAFHDANGNGKVDLKRKGVPAEAHGYHKRSTQTPPAFPDAVIHLNGERKEVALTVF